MSDQTVTLALEERTVLGKAVRQLRRDGYIPAVVHDHGKESLHVMAPYRDILKTYEQAGKHHPVELTIGKRKQTALIKDVDFEPTKQQLRHVVFNAISQNEKVETEVPLTVLEAEIPAEKVGLMIITQATTVMVEALPRDLPDSFEIDPSNLTEVGDKITVADISVPEGVTITTDPEQTVLVVEAPKTFEQQLEEAGETPVEEEAAGEAAEGEELAEQESSEEQQ